ncbi:uncharacterized protein EDB91DRAFT_1089486, partial [Suillus paluster]|uniref:uncharacterized protein n=1 Tax=Suillus paluster TaxID=48578 RepID=UPI001B876F37
NMVWMDNIMDFWEDVLQMEADEITRKLKQWACMSGCRAIVKRCDIRINYTNFGIAMKEKLGVDIRGWPEDVPFQSPTSINYHNALLKLCNGLKNGSCLWFHMSLHQREEYSAHLAVWHKKGEVVGKAHKKHSDAGVPHKCKGKENGH